VGMLGSLLLNWMLEMKIKPFFLWRDMWVGLFFDNSKRIVYICPIPMCGIAIHLPRKSEEIDE
jgi:hypothetical protein